MNRLLMLLAAGFTLAGCSLAIDTDDVPRPAEDSPPVTCTPIGCAGVTCGYVDCGTVCEAGSGCLVTHRVTGGGFTSGSAQPVLPAPGPYVSGGRVTGSTAGTASAAGGHQVTGGTVQ